MLRKRWKRSLTIKNFVERSFEMKKESDKCQSMNLNVKYAAKFLRCYKELMLNRQRFVFGVIKDQ
jgi:hypothetical protein